MAYTKKKTRSRRYPAEAMTGVDYADDLALLVNTPTQAESLLHSLELAVGEDSDLHGNAKEGSYFPSKRNSPKSERIENAPLAILISTEQF